MDARQKKVLTVLGVGLIILGWRGYVLLTEYLPARVEAGPAPVDAVGAQGADADQRAGEDPSETRWAAQRQVAEDDWGQRTPFTPAPRAPRGANGDLSTATASSSEAPPAPQIQFVGVSRSADQWLASIQGRIVRVGEELDGGYRVVEINRHSITLAFRGWAYTFVLGSPETVVRPLREEP